MGKHQRFDPYKPCPCGSGEKYKFCCYEAGREPPSVMELGLARHDHERSSEEAAPEAGPDWFETPFARAILNGSWRKMGMAGLYVFRRSGDKLFGHAYLVDVFGLGLKDCYPIRPMSESAVQDFAQRKVEAATQADLPLAQTLVWGGLRYARENGFRPPACAPSCTRAVGGEPIGGAIPKNVFGYAGGVHIVGDWEDLSRRLIRPQSFDDACGEWSRRGFHFTVGSRNPSFLEGMR